MDNTIDFDIEDFKFVVVSDIESSFIEIGKKEIVDALRKDGWRLDDKDFSGSSMSTFTKGNINVPYLMVIGFIREPDTSLNDLVRKMDCCYRRDNDGIEIINKDGYDRRIRIITGR